MDGILGTPLACQVITKKAPPRYGEGERPRSKESGPEGRKDSIKRRARIERQPKKVSEESHESSKSRENGSEKVSESIEKVSELNFFQWKWTKSRGHFLLNEFV